MVLSDVSIKRPVMAVMMTAALVLFGWIALERLPVREMPKMDFPVVTVTVSFPGASAEVVEKEVTDLVEEQVNTVEGIRFIQSVSSDGGSSTTVQFELEKDIDVAAQEVRDKVSEIRRKLPDDIDEPVIQKFDLDARAIMWIALTATDRDRVELTEYADKILKPEFERLPGVGQILIGGMQEFAVRVWLDADELAAHDLTVSDVANALETQNAEIPSGRIEGTDREFSVRTEGDMTTVGAFNDLFLAYRKGTPVYLKDVGYAEAGPRDTRATARFTRPPDVVGQESVGLGVLKQTDANTVSVAHAVKERLAELRETLPPGMHLIIAFDSSIYVEESVAELTETLVIGGLLAAVIVFLFLASFRSSFVTTISIPTSIISTFAVVYFLGFTINTLTMLALVLAVGMVIDDAVVVVENIFRHRQMGKGAVQAAREGTSEIAFAVIAATLSIAVVFLPLAFVKGIVGKLLLEFAVTVAGSILISMFVALTLIPMLSSRFLGGKLGHGRFGEIVDMTMERVSRVYSTILVRALHARWAVIAAGIGLLAVSGLLFRSLGKELSPSVDEGSFLMSMKGPQGATIDYTNVYMRRVEKILASTPEVGTAFTAIGLARGGVPKVNEGIAFVRLKPLAQRQAEHMRGQREVMTALRQQMMDIPGFLTLVMPRPTIASTSGYAPIQLVVMGPEVDKLYQLSEELKSRVSAIPGIVDVDSDLDINKPQLKVRPDRAMAADLGVDITDIAEALRVLLGGDDITQFKKGGERYDVMVQLEPNERRVPEAIDKIYVHSRTGVLVPLSSVVDLHETVGPSEIHRYNRARSFTLTANLEGKPLAQALRETEAAAAELLPAGYRTAVTGESDDMRESFNSLLFTFALAIVVIYMVLASQFNHFVHPFTIMLSLPLALFGALGLLWVLGLTINLFSIIGIIMLTGIATRNAILLVDYANQLREQEGVVRDTAVVEAGKVRLRPILMTAFSTILGVLPALIGLGAGSESRRPLAAAVVGGMMTATVLTLVVVPVVYTFMDDLGHVLLHAARNPREAAALGLDWATAKMHAIGDLRHGWNGRKKPVKPTG